MGESFDSDAILGNNLFLELSKVISTDNTFTPSEYKYECFDLTGTWTINMKTYPVEVKIDRSRGKSDNSWALWKKLEFDKCRSTWNGTSNFFVFTVFDEKCNAYLYCDFFDNIMDIASELQKKRPIRNKKTKQLEYFDTYRIKKYAAKLAVHRDAFDKDSIQEKKSIMSQIYQYEKMQRDCYPILKISTLEYTDDLTQCDALIRNARTGDVHPCWIVWEDSSVLMPREMQGYQVQGHITKLSVKRALETFKPSITNAYIFILSKNMKAKLIVTPLQSIENALIYDNYFNYYIKDDMHIAKSIDMNSRLFSIRGFA